MISPCTVWATRTDMPDECSDAAVKPTTLDNGLRYASTVLFNLTKRRYAGSCSDVWRPFDMLRCWNPQCTTHGAVGNGSVFPRDGVSYAYAHNAIKLPVRNVRAITAITIAGTTIDPATYEVRDGRFLYRKLARTTRLGQTSWPCWQDLHEWDGETDTFVISYSYGLSPPAELVLACALLGWEFAVGWTPDCSRECRLPRNITSMSRGGVTLQFPNPSLLFTDGKTNIPDVDMLVQAVMRGDAQSGAVVAIPGKTSIGSRSTWHS